MSASDLIIPPRPFMREHEIGVMIAGGILNGSAWCHCIYSSGC